jgi:UDP-N-acetylmuramoylalanine--D-glutamate ligase
VRELGLDEATIEKGLKSFNGLPHRMERVAESNGVIFINDSKATNPASTAPALAAFPPVEGHKRLHWIVGGLPKGVDLDDCAGGFPMWPPPTPLATPGRCSPKSLRPICRSSAPK